MPSVFLCHFIDSTHHPLHHFQMVKTVTAIHLQFYNLP